MTRLEVLKKEFAKEWQCDRHGATAAGDNMINPLKGAAVGCEFCITQVAAIVCAAMNIKVPTRLPVPEDPLDKYTLMDSQSIPAAMTKKAREIGELIGAQCPPGVGFMLMLFEFNTNHKEYISNGRREDMIRVMREMADDFEKGDMGEQHPH